jgi:hypothetical protein
MFARAACAEIRRQPRHGELLGKSVSALARQYGGLTGAATALDYASVGRCRKRLRSSARDNAIGHRGMKPSPAASRGSGSASQTKPEARQEPQ